VDKGSAVREYLVVLRRRWWLIAVAVAAALAVALVVSFTTTPLYRASTQLRYQKQPDLASAISGATVMTSSLDAKQEINTYSNLMDSAEMRTAASAEAPQLDLTASRVQVSSVYVEDTNVMVLSAVSSDPALAMNAANAYANAFVDARKAAIRLQYYDARMIIKRKLSRFSEAQIAANDPSYVSLLGRLQDLGVFKAAATGNFVVASVAELPTEPFKPNHVRDAAIAGLVGLIAGIGLVALAEQLDVRVHSVEDIAQITGLPVIGRLPRIGKEAAAKGDLPVVSQPQGPLSEAFRMVRGNLEFVDVDGDLKTILFTSCTQSEGKTSTVCNLAVTLARSGKSVVVVDADLRRPRVHALFGLQNRIGVSTVVTGQSSLEDSLQCIPGAPQQGQQVGSLLVLPSGPVPPNPGELVASRRLGAVIAKLAEQADIVLVDAAPVLVVGDAGALAGSVQGLILIARIGVVTKSMLQEVRDFLASLPIRKLGAVVTAIPSEGSAYRYSYDREKSESDTELDTEPLGTPALPGGSIPSLPPR
jgi:capsular exopolysaccharide synthesis family protein